MDRLGCALRLYRGDSPLGHFIELDARPGRHLANGCDQLVRFRECNKPISFLSCQSPIEESLSFAAKNWIELKAGAPLLFSAAVRFLAGSSSWPLAC
jgi:hypothetical protein